VSLRIDCCGLRIIRERLILWGGHEKWVALKWEVEDAVKSRIKGLSVTQYLVPLRNPHG